MLSVVVLIAGAVGTGASALWVLRRAATVEHTSSPIVASIVLVRRLLTDRRVGLLPKVLLVVPVAYEVSPIQLIPNFIPVLGQLDNVVVLGICLRAAARCVPRPLLAELWPGPEPASADRHQLPWQRFHFWPLPQVQRSLRPRAASSDA